MTTRVSLAVGDFAAFFEALWGFAPFPWQQRLLATVVEQGWPHTLDLPTGSGKTAVLDVAVFALAVDADRAPGERRQRRRVVMVIDRRVVVDQAWVRARAMARALAEAQEGVLAAVASRLRRLQGDDEAEPLRASVLRGGMARDDDWARSPAQPTIIVSTVDQVGSRLLFRGYGVSNAMRPIHAGLLGHDALYLLDEVHLSRPFEQTLSAIAGHAAVQGGPSGGLDVVRMSATPGGSSVSVFELAGDDRAHPVLARRIGASKRATLRSVKTTARAERKARAAIAAACIEEVTALWTDEVGVAAVIVNRVDTARQVAALAEAQAARSGWEVALVTGRMRPLDRHDLFQRLDVALQDRAHRAPDHRILVVSTQTLEAGADFDFDALVTECASLDALRQRFGRLDRRGDLGRTRATIVAASHQVTFGDDATSAPPVDPVYGEALAWTWRWLGELAAADEGEAVDFGIGALGAQLDGLAPEALAPMLARRDYAPHLLPTFLDLWAQTAPRPDVEPEVAPFLHGPRPQSPDVQIVWRADLEPDWLRAAGAGDRAWTEALADVLSSCPPSALEALSVPLWAARAWLASVEVRRAGGAQHEVPAVADVEGATAEEAVEDGAMAPALIWRGDETVVASTSVHLHPGATLVVPASYGGLARGNWAPDAVDPVRDRGDEAQVMHRGRASVRWSPAVIAAWSAAGDGRHLAPPSVSDDDIEALGARAERQAFSDWLDDVAASSLPAWQQVALPRLRRALRMVRVELPDGTVWRVSLALRPLPPTTLRELWLARGGELAALIDPFSTDEDTAAFTAREIALDVHLAAVRDQAHRFTEALGLPPTLASDLTLAAALHDAGKADPRFQLWLHNGDAVRLAMAPSPLAKSATPLQDRAARMRARTRAGYPPGTRHELLSVAMAQRHPTLRDRATDWDLVLHLIASHHGHGRPFAPLVPDPHPVHVHVVLGDLDLEAPSDHGLARLDGGVMDRFWRLVRRYGWWRLAWFEAVLRLADHRTSQREQEVPLDEP